MTEQIIFSIAGTLAFAITMNSPKKSLPFVAIGATICSIFERTLSALYDDFTACLCAMVLVAFFCEITARIQKSPVTVFLVPCIIPLLPGSSIYYTMLYAIQHDIMQAEQYALSTLLAGLGIALGAVIESAIMKIICSLKK